MRGGGRKGGLVAMLAMAGWLCVTASGKEINYGQAKSKQQKEDWAGAVTAYLAVIEDLWATKPESSLLPKCYIGCAFCAGKMGDIGLALQCLSDLWETGAWANPNLPRSPEYLGYQYMAQGRYLDAINEFAQLVRELPPGTKRSQEAKLSLAWCHLCLGGRGHVRVARRLFEDVVEEGGETKLKAFSQWMSGVTFLALLDVVSAEQQFNQAYATDPTLDPSETAEEIVVDMLQPPVSVQSSLSDSRDDLAQLLEDYVNAWYLTAKAQDAVNRGEMEEASSLFAEADALWSQMSVSMPSFPVY